ncbi:MULTISPECIES: hypothetical protein [unclassified Clostridium]|uniref:hypothetical protein n=1 Tax=unclassified Clostridium TaxID=2614128 RepID=UPI0002975337|nr:MULTISPECIES: hypothetical protein [unclassified Clostridium]EKQ52399.1 MAG: hypothetical protein A370_04232 [Clostridium sp. Maddingley MBC34-26]
MKYIFYWDESSHTRKITGKNKSVNIYGENENDIYISVYIGGESNQISYLLEDYRVIENEFKQKRKFDNQQELKGTNFKKKNFTYGVKTFNEETMSFYSKFFKALYDNKTYYHITMISKTEILIEQSFKGITNPFVKAEAFYYSLIKFLYNYRCIPFMLEFFEEDTVSKNDLIDKIKDILIGVIDKTNDIPRKVHETGTLKQLLFILDKFSVQFDTKLKYPWDYTLVYEGFNNYLKEMNIYQSDCHLYMDKESKVHEYGLNYSYGIIEEVDSKQKIGVRISDILSNFIERISYAIQVDMKEIEIQNVHSIRTEDFERKNLLSREWFDINEYQFQLYKLIAKYFALYGDIYWSSYTGIYSDDTVKFFSLFHYIDIYETYEEFRKIDPFMHTEKYNACVCERLNESFDNM